ncbi:uncharacterized protein [Eucyclogobius newberryi]|uniref:uncharacterized protein n=1 Tax=Eucyclogobius newberryi TaxID=166745 RepID=UPI003B5A5C88
MEGRPGVLDDEPVVLWEKYIQQSIIVDLSEDESIHLSDLESSLACHISPVESAPAEASIYFSGIANPSDYDISSVSVINGGHVINPHTISSELPVSVQRPNTEVQDVPSQNLSHDDPGQNTSDEDHEELPYDDLGSLYFNHVPNSDMSQGGRQTSCGDPNFNEPIIKTDVSNVKPTFKAIESLAENASANQDKASHTEDISIKQLISKDDLLGSGRLIEAETLPEVSLLDSMDDTVYSRASVHNSKPCYHGLTSICETNHNNSEQKSNENGTGSLIQTKNINNDGTSSIAENVLLYLASDCSKYPIICDTVSDEAEEELENNKAPLLRARSFNEIKYGQGQVHYPLPDFSKVAPKVKIPKTPKESPKSMPQPPSTIHRTHSSPEMLDLVSRVLEDSALVFIEPDTSASPALEQHLQVAAEPRLCFDGSQDYVAEGSLLNPLDKSDKVPTVTQCTDTASPVKSEVGPSDGELMTSELSNIVTQFMQNVEAFKLNVSNKSINLEDQQMMLSILMEALDQLERKYINKKEEHRALEMQKYMGINRNTGTFDPDRLVEGGIFRLGMILDDTKEMISKNVCEQISPPQCSSTPLSFNVHIQPHVLCLSPPLALQEIDPICIASLHNGHVLSLPVALYCFSSTAGVRLLHSEGLCLFVLRSPHTFQKGCLTPSLEDKEQQDEESVVIEGTDYSNILAYFDVTDASPGENLAADSNSAQKRALHLASDRDNCASLSVEISSSSEASKGSNNKPPFKTSVSQRNVSLETDSGFGSSYLNQSASGSFQQHLNERFHYQKDPVSSTDSEDSCSNLQTTIEPVTKTQRALSSVRSELPGASPSVQQWVESTNKEGLFREQGTKHNHVSESVSVPHLGRMDKQRSPVHSCPCNNEAILVLQSEVSRLKKDMKEGLIQLPYLADKLDYLTSKYRQERMTKSRSRSQQCPLKSPTIGQTLSNTFSSPVKLEWMSTHIDPGRSRATDTEDTTASDMQLDYSPIEGRKCSDFLHLDSGLHSPGAVPSSRGFSERWSPICSTPIQKPLLQVNYGSSSSLPASYKLRENPLQPAAYDRKRSTQSDTALLPSNVFFQHTVSPLSAPSKLDRTSKHSKNKEEDIHRTLDKAIEAARSMKKTTDRMAKSLSADLPKASQKKLYKGKKKKKNYDL